MPQISQSSLISYVPAVASPRLVVVSVVSSLQHLRSTVLRTMTSCFTSGSSSKDETRPDRPPERHGICLSCPRLSVGIFH